MIVDLFVGVSEQLFNTLPVGDAVGLIEDALVLLANGLVLLPSPDVLRVRPVDLP